MSQKPSTAKGTRDFLPNTVSKRTFLIQTIKSVFETFGFLPIETPAFEKTSTLMGKYGDEGDRLIFKILNSGEKVKKADLKALEEDRLAAFSNSLSEKALRYDLTVPFARFVVQHQNDLVFPFKRYQIQPVWRADRPQHGRFQEFYQCDADAVGSTSLWQEVEFIQIYDRVFNKLNIPSVTIRINHRKILAGMAEMIGADDQLIPFTTSLDKLDKIGQEGVENELISKGFNAGQLEKLRTLFNLKGKPDSVLAKLRETLADSAIAQEGIEDLNKVIERCGPLKLQTDLEIQLTLARGLNYYTGLIFEVAAPPEVSIGSIGGGGRYDDLTSGFGLKDMSGVGISFGLDRIYMVLEALNLFPDALETSCELLVLNFKDDLVERLLPYIQGLRSEGLRISLYPDAVKLGKQLAYADKNKIPYALIFGTDEASKNEVLIKNLNSGAQKLVPLNVLNRTAILSV